MSNPPRSLVTHQQRRLKKPAWLRFLLFIQHTSSIITVALVISTLVTYAGVVYSQQQWSRNYEKLTKLQRAQRDLTATNETLKNQLAEQVEQPDNGFIAPNPDNMIVLPSPSQGKSQDNQPKIKQKSPKPKVTSPLGY